jgi:hypothetical protein
MQAFLALKMEQYIAPKLWHVLTSLDGAKTQNTILITVKTQFPQEG